MIVNSQEYIQIFTNTSTNTQRNLLKINKPPLYTYIDRFMYITKYKQMYHIERRA